MVSDPVGIRGLTVTQVIRGFESRQTPGSSRSAVGVCTPANGQWPESVPVEMPHKAPVGEQAGSSCNRTQAGPRTLESLGWL